MYELEKTEYKGFIIRVINDECPGEPDWGDDEFFLVIKNKRYRMGRDDYSDPESHLAWGEGRWGEYGEAIPAPPPPGDESEAYDLYEEWQEEYDASYQVFPFTCGNAHGPGSFSFWLMEVDDTRHREPDGWIFVKKPETDLEALSKPEWTPEAIRDALIERYETWANGDVWGYVIEDKDGNELDSCWGFYGSERCREEAERVADSLVGRTRDVGLIVFTTSGWESVVVSLPVEVPESRACLWALENKLRDPVIRGAALFSSFVQAPERTPTEQLAAAGDE